MNNTLKYNVIDVKHNNHLTIAQIKYSDQNSFYYISLHEAVNLGKIVIEEVSDSGIVNEVFIINQSDMSVFIMDGDLLRGAKQNRVLNSSVLLAPNSKNLIPVSCVERGRWSHTVSSFIPSDEIAAKNIRMDKHDDIYNKGNTIHKKHSVSQSKVWDNVSDCFDKSGLVGQSSTESHSDMFHYKRNNFRSYVNGFKCNLEANGLVYLINNKIMGCELFNRTNIYAVYFDKILTTIGFEIDSKLYGKNIYNSTFGSHEIMATYEIEDMLSSIFVGFDNHIKGVDICPAIALGEESRYKSNQNMFYSLFFNNHMIHKSLLVTGV